jgi:hypothetical protein
MLAFAALLRLLSPKALVRLNLNQFVYHKHDFAEPGFALQLKRLGPVGR